MATLAEIHDAIAQRLGTIYGLRAFPTPPQGVTFPTAWVQFEGWTTETMSRRGVKTMRFSVFVFTAESARPQDGYLALMPYADRGDRSVELALWNGNTATGFGDLDGVHVSSTSFDVLGATEIDAFQAYGGRFDVVVHVKED